jgi:hypothetical protein
LRKAKSTGCSLESTKAEESKSGSSIPIISCCNVRVLKAETKDSSDAAERAVAG